MRKILNILKYILFVLVILINIVAISFILEYGNLMTYFRSATKDIPQNITNQSELNVRNFGAIGDGRTDDTKAFQKAIDEANTLGGMTVFVPSSPAGYLILGTLDLKDFVTLKGSGEAPSIGSFNRFNENKFYGSVLLTKNGKGNKDAKPFINLGRNATLSNITIFYPEQVYNQKPLEYPWTIEFSSNKMGAALVNTLIVNPYNAVKIVNHEKVFIDGLYGQPLNTGLFLDQAYDVPRIHNIHFWQFWKEFDQNGKTEKFMLENAEGIRFERVDDFMLNDVLIYGYKSGIKLSPSRALCEDDNCIHTPYGSMTNIDIDGSCSGIDIDGISTRGVKIANLQIHALFCDDANAIKFNKNIGQDNALVQITNADFLSSQNTSGIINFGSESRNYKFIASNINFRDVERTNSKLAINNQGENIIKISNCTSTDGDTVKVRNLSTVDPSNCNLSK